MSHLISIARNPRKKRKDRSFVFEGWPHGLNTSVDPSQIAKTELSKCVNYIIHPDGQLENRIPIKKYTTTAVSGNAKIKFTCKIPIGTTSYEFIIDENYILYNVLNGTLPVAIATLEGDATIIPFKGVGLIMDGSYCKYIDSASTGGVKICYDSGTGVGGHQFDNDSDTATGGAINLSTSGRAAAAYKFTSSALDTGYTIPPTTMKARLSKIGAPTGSIFAVIKDTSNVVKAKTSFGATAQELTSGSTGGYGTLYSVTFTSTDITSEMTGSTAFYACVEYSLGSATSYVQVDCTTGTGKKGYYVSGSTYVAVTTKDPRMSLRPGTPPKAKYGVVKKGSPFVYGDSSNPSNLYVGNGTYLDWSTSDGGATVGLVDENATNFPIGGIGVIFDDLFVYGKQNQPCLAQLTGASPSSYALPLLYQQAWATQKTLVSTANDLWTASADGVDPLSGVQEYGDVRTFSASDPVIDRLRDYWDTDDTIACYYPKYGLYMLSFPTYRRVLASRTKQPVQDPSEQHKRYPWTEFEFYREELNSSSYNWISTGSGTNEYYCTGSTGTATTFLKPDAVTLDRANIIEGTSGALEDHQWDHSGSTVIIRDDSGDPDTTGVDIKTLIIPTSMAIHDGELIIGSSDGFLYKTDSSEYKDMEVIQTDPLIETAYMELPYAEINIQQIQLMSSGFAGAGVTLEIYTNGTRGTPLFTSTVNLPASDQMTKDEWTMDKADMLFAKNPLQTPKWRRPNLRCRSFKVGIKDVTIPLYPLFHKTILVRYRNLEV